MPVFLAQAGRDRMIDPQTVFRTASALYSCGLHIHIQWYPHSGHVVTVVPRTKKLEQDVWAFLEASLGKVKNERDD